MNQSYDTTAAVGEKNSLNSDLPQLIQRYDNIDPKKHLKK